MSSMWTDTADNTLVQEVVRMQRSSDPAAFPLWAVQKQGHPDYVWLFDVKHPLHKVYKETLATPFNATNEEEIVNGRHKRVRDGEDTAEQSCHSMNVLSTSEGAEARASLFQPFSLLDTGAAATSDGLPSHHGPHRPYSLNAVDHRLWTTLLYHSSKGGAHFHDCIQFALGRVTKSEYLLECICRLATVEEKLLLSIPKVATTAAGRITNSGSSSSSVELVYSLFFLVSSLLAEHEQGAAGRKVPFPPYRPVFAHYIPKLVAVLVGMLGADDEEGSRKHVEEEKNEGAEEKLDYLRSVLNDWKEANLFPLAVVEEWAMLVEKRGRGTGSNGAVAAVDEAKQGKTSEVEAV